MILEAQLKELLAQKTESRNLDFKERFNWHTAGNEEKCEVVKDILAFLNTQDGGQIVFGVQDSTLEPIGLNEDDFSSFDPTKVNDFLQRYTDPTSSCEVQKLSSGGRRFVVISVPEFKDVPVICKRDANSSKDQSKIILKAGGLYVRTEKATSVLVPAAGEMRDLMNRALLRRGDQLLSTIRTLLLGSPPSKEQGLRKYEEEIEAAHEYFKQTLPAEFESSGYWELTAEPHPYSRERISDLKSLWKFLTEATVSLRGWNFPHTDRETQSNFSTGRQSHTVASVFGKSYIEAFRAYKNGLFVWRGAYRENNSEFVKQYGKALSFVNIIYEVTEMFVFIKRYYERVAPDASVRISIEMHDIENRQLVTTEWDVELFDDYTSRVRSYLFERDYTVPALRASAEEFAIAAVQDIFEIFNWNDADPNDSRLAAETLE